MSSIPHRRFVVTIALVIGILSLLCRMSLAQTTITPPIDLRQYVPVPSSLLVAVQYFEHKGLYRIKWFQGPGFGNPSTHVMPPDFWRVYVPPGTIHIGITSYKPMARTGLLVRYGQAPKPITLPENWDHYQWKSPALLDQLKTQDWVVRTPAPTGCATALTCIDKWVYPPVELGGWIFGASLGEPNGMQVEMLIDRVIFDEWRLRTTFDLSGNPPLATEVEDPESKVMMHLYPNQDPELMKGVINLHRPGVKRVYTIPANTSRAVFRILR